MLLSAALVAACGGGGDAAPPGGPPPVQPGQPGQPDPTAPQISHFSAPSAEAFVGERVRLRADFSGGSGRIDPGVGAVASGAEAWSQPLDRDTVFRLVVTGAQGREASRTLAVSVRHRDRWQVLPTTLRASQHAAVASDDGGQVLVIGGSRGEGVLSASVDRVDPRSGVVQRIALMQQGRAGHTATRLPDGSVLVAGGMTSSGDARPAERIDERGGRVDAAGRLGVARVSHAAALLPGGRVLVTGGIATGEGNPLGVSASAEIWEPATQTFRRLAARMHTPRADHTMTPLGDGRVLVVGGYTSRNDARVAEIFDPASETFVPVDTLAPMRANHVAVETPDGRVLILGGEMQRAGEDEPVAIAGVLRFEPATGRFTELPPLARPRTLARGIVIPGGAVLLLGGSHESGVHADSAERWEAPTGGRAIARLDGERALHTATRLGDGRIALIGGETGRGHFATTVLLYE